MIMLAPSKRYGIIANIERYDFTIHNQYKFSFIGEIAKPAEPAGGQDERRISCAAVDSPARLC